MAYAILEESEMSEMTALPHDHPMMKAWNEWQSTDEFMDVLKWSVATKYDDGRLISDIQREQHVKGGLWLAFTKGIEVEQY